MVNKTSKPSSYHISIIIRITKGLSGHGKFLSKGAKYDNPLMNTGRWKDMGGGVVRMQG